MKVSYLTKAQTYHHLNSNEFYNLITETYLKSCKMQQTQREWQKFNLYLLLWYFMVFSFDILTHTHTIPKRYRNAICWHDTKCLTWHFTCSHITFLHTRKIMIITISIILIRIFTHLNANEEKKKFAQITVMTRLGLHHTIPTISKSFRLFVLCRPSKCTWFGMNISVLTGQTTNRIIFPCVCVFCCSCHSKNTLVQFVQHTSKPVP